MAKKIESKKVSEMVILKSLEKRAALPMKKVKAIKKIKNNTQSVIKLDNMKILKELKGEGMRQMNDIVAPIESSVKKIKALFHPFFEKIKELEESTKADVYRFLESKEKSKLELDHAYAKGKVNGIAMMKKKDALTVDVGNASVAKVWTAVPVDESKTPRAYMVPDETAIREALKEGKKVAGWEWRQVNNVRI